MRWKVFEKRVYLWFRRIESNRWKRFQDIDVFNFQTLWLRSSEFFHLFKKFFVSPGLESFVLVELDFHLWLFWQSLVEWIMGLWDTYLLILMILCIIFDAFLLFIHHLVIFHSFLLDFFFQILLRTFLSLRSFLVLFFVLMLYIFFFFFIMLRLDNSILWLTHDAFPQVLFFAVIVAIILLWKDLWSWEKNFRNNPVRTTFLSLLLICDWAIERSNLLEVPSWEE